MEKQRESNKYFSKCSAPFNQLFLDVIIQQIKYGSPNEASKNDHTISHYKIFLTWKLTFNFSAVFKGHTVSDKSWSISKSTET